MEPAVGFVRAAVAEGIVTCGAALDGACMFCVAARSVRDFGAVCQLKCCNAALWLLLHSWV